MKILFLSAANSVHTARWVNAISERGHDVVLVSKIDHKNTEGNISKNVKILYLPITGAKGYYLNSPKLKKIAGKEKPDVINVHYASGYGTLARIARLPNYILNVWGSDVYDFPCESRLKESILKKNLKSASVLASTSHSMANQTKKYVCGRKIEVTPFGVDTEKFCAYSKKEKQDIFVFGIVKTLSKKYGVSTVIKAFSMFVKQLEETRKADVMLRIYGKGELLDELKSLAKECDVENKVFFLGYINNNDVPQVLNEMDVFLLGSESESFGVAAVEAMACELPIVATNVSGFREVIEAGKTGYLVDINDAEAMYEYMMKLYSDEQLREEMGLAGRKRVEKLYDWNKNVDEMLALYKEVME